MTGRIPIAAVFVFFFHVADGASDATSLYEWSAQIDIHPTAITLNGFDLESQNFHVCVKNTGTRTWNAKAERLALSYHVRAEDNVAAKWDNQRFALPELKPGESTVLNVPAPNDIKPGYGKFILAFDIVREEIAWFAATNPANRFPEASIDLTKASLADLRDEPALKKARSLAVGIENVDRATALAFYTLHKSPKTFSTPSGNLTALTAGATYPQSWIRDCATGIAAAYLALGDTAARGCILLHLFNQHDDGYVNDWVDGNGEKDKNTVEADQESSLVIAATEYVDSSGNTAFLSSKVNAVAVLDRLGLALNYVWVHRRDPETGLVTSGHTIDWGDVSIEEGDQQAIYLSARSHLVAGIYTNAMYAMAIRNYLHLLGAQVGASKQVRARWTERSHLLAGKINQYLWNEAHGYFVMHRHVTPLNLPADESAMFALGGNAVAIEAGLANKRQADRITRNALRLQAQYHAATLSGVLYPPFPDGVYQHPMVRQSFTYQNGGLWDWFGLRLVRTMFKANHPQAGCRALEEIAAKVVRNGTFSEWDDLDGHAEGSKDYIGAAGQYVAAVKELNSYVTRERRLTPSFSAHNLCVQAAHAER